jgi:hypothetical protein
VTSVQKKIPRIVIYIVLIGITLITGLILGYSPGSSLTGFFTFLFIGIWASYTVGIIIRIKKMREYHATLNNGVLIFGNLLISSLYGIWGDFTPFLVQKLFPSTFLQINWWIAIFSLPYLVFSIFLLLFSITKYFSIYLGNKAFNARKFTVLMALIFLIIDLNYIFLRQGVYSLDIFDFTPLLGTINIYMIVHLSIVTLFGIIGIATRNRSMSSYNLDNLTDRMNDIDRRIQAADSTSNAARRIEQRAQDAERRRKERERQKKKEDARRRRTSVSSRPTYVSQSKSKSKSSSRTSKATVKSSLSKKELLSMRPKTGVLSKEDFMCIFCFELPNPSDKDGIVLCPHCRYPAHYHEFKEWVRTSKLCSRCDGVLPSSFIRNPKVIPVKTYLKAYKYFKRQF